MAEKKFIIEVRSKGFGKANADMDKLAKKTKNYSDETERVRGRTKGFIAQLGSLRNKILVYTFAVGGAAAAMNKFIQAASGFQDVQTRLVGLTGSVEGAKEAFDAFNQIAATTPFALQDVVNAGAQLEAFGVDSKATLSAVTDLAAFMGTTATEAASSLGRAFAGGAGAADILRERGILQLIKDSQGITDLTKLTLPEFRKALLSAMVDPVAGIQGSSKRLAQTFTGAVSNMNDAITRFAAMIGDLMIPSMTKTVQSIEKFFRALDLKRLAELATAFGVVTSAIVLSRIEMKKLLTVTTVLGGKWMLLVKAIGALTGAIAIDKLLQASDAFSSLSTNVNTLTHNTNQGTNAYQRYINSLQNTTIALGLTTDEQDRINQMHMDTVLLTMQLNDVDEKRIRIAQTIFRAEQNLSDAMKTKIKFDREAAVLGQVKIDLSNATTEAEIQEAQAVMRLVQAQVDNIEQGKEVITTSNSLANSLNHVAGAMRQLKDGSLDSTEAFSLFLSTASAIVGASNPIAGAILGVGSSFVGHTGGLVRNNGIQRFAQGGQVQGQDNVPILAQAGEFIMRKEAVQNIGLQNLAEMNRSSSRSGTVTVNIQGNMIGNDEFVRDNLIPSLQQVSNQNLA